MKTITEMLVHCEHDGSMIPVSEVRRLMREYTAEQCQKRDELIKVQDELIEYMERDGSGYANSMRVKIEQLKNSIQ